MKKNIFVLALSLTFATAAHAETTIDWTQAGCESVGGTWITAHSATDEGCDAAHCNGLNFCRSAQKMNFFSALIWCKSIGHKLVDIDTACPNSISSQKCQNLKIGLSSTLFWSSMPSPYKDGQTVYFRADSGIDLDGKKNTDAVFALCKE